MWKTKLNAYQQLNNAAPSTPGINEQGYSLGARWLNTVTKKIYTLVDDTPGAQVWIDETLTSLPITSQDADRPERFYLLDLGTYPVKQSIPKELIQYTRVFIEQGLVIEGGETFIASGSAAKKVRFGLYNQDDPVDRNGVPFDKIRETAETGTAGLTDQYLTPNWTSGDYTIPNTGFYWIAMVVDTSPDLMITEREYFANFLPRYEQTTTGTTLPTQASGLSSPKSAVAFAAIVRQI